mmetsp:Transcript_66961/g.145511  ORF Transcript_66961/g.145511 Transcript_66961/m.145511 type:complete len:612 (-) Transcript_66961:1876-3711(-)
MTRGLASVALNDHVQGLQDVLGTEDHLGEGALGEASSLVDALEDVAVALVVAEGLLGRGVDEVRIADGGASRLRIGHLHAAVGTEGLDVGWVGVRHGVALLLLDFLELSHDDNLVGEVHLPGLLSLQLRVCLDALFEALHQRFTGGRRRRPSGAEILLRGAVEGHLQAVELLQVHASGVDNGGDDRGQGGVVDGPPLASCKGLPIGNASLASVGEGVEEGLLAPLHGLALALDVLAFLGLSELVRGLVPLHGGLGEIVHIDSPAASVPVAKGLAPHHQGGDWLVQHPGFGSVEHVVSLADHANGNLRPLLLQGELQSGVEVGAGVGDHVPLEAVLAVAGSVALAEGPLEGQGVQEVAGGVLAKQLGLQLGRHAVVAVRSGGELHLRPLRGAHGESVATSDLVPSLLAQPECLVASPLGALLDLLPASLVLLHLALLRSQSLLLGGGADACGGHGLRAIEGRLQALGQVMGQLGHGGPLVLHLGQVTEAGLSLEFLQGAPAREGGGSFDAIVCDLGEADQLVLRLGHVLLALVLSTSREESLIVPAVLLLLAPGHVEVAEALLLLHDLQLVVGAEGRRQGADELLQLLRLVFLGVLLNVVGVVLVEIAHLCA